MKSAIFIGRVRHRRFAPRPHAFAYRLFMVYLDLAELDEAFRGRWLWSCRRAALARFRREDHLGDPDVPLDTAVRDLVAARTGKRPRGPIRLLTHLSYFGYCFNPVSFYYCFDSDDRGLDAIVAEVANTPWGERHCYVLEGGNGGRYRLAKQFHVSPFMPMDVAYDWRFSVPSAKLGVHMQSERGGDKLFDATLALERRELGAVTLALALSAHPFMTLKVIAAIYWQAFRLWRMRTPFFPHPRKSGFAEGKTP